MLVKDYQDNYGTGWISLYRSIKEHWVWKDANNLKIWIDFLMRANHRQNKIIIDSELIDIFRGTFITSLKKLAKEYGVSISKIRHLLNLLEKDSMIILNTTHKYTQITICNYETYQDAQQTERKQKENRKKTERKQKETNNNVNNVNNENKEVVMYPVNKIKQEYFVDLLPIDSTQQFIEAWNEWVDFRKEIKKTITKSTAKKQIAFLLIQPDPIECINKSIRSGWAGLFPIKEESKTTQSRNEKRFGNSEIMNNLYGDKSGH